LGGKANSGLSQLNTIIEPRLLQYDQCDWQVIELKKPQFWGHYKMMKAAMLPDLLLNEDSVNCAKIEALEIQLSNLYSLCFKFWLFHSG